MLFCYDGVKTFFFVAKKCGLNLSKIRAGGIVDSGEGYTLSQLRSVFVLFGITKPNRLLVSRAWLAVIDVSLDQPIWGSLY